jgi:hypothetical protein
MYIGDGSLFLCGMIIDFKDGSTLIPLYDLHSSLACLKVY